MADGEGGSVRSPGDKLRGGGDMPGNGAVGLAGAMAAIQENVEYFEGDEEWVDVEEVKVNERWNARTTGGDTHSEHLYACVLACVRACVRACVYVCVRVWMVLAPCIRTATLTCGKRRRQRVRVILYLHKCPWI